MIARWWSGRVRAEDVDAYVAYVEATGIRAIRAAPGNVSAAILVRPLGDDAGGGLSGEGGDGPIVGDETVGVGDETAGVGDDAVEVGVFSVWESWAAVEGFAGARPELAVYYPEDERYLTHAPERVTHWEVRGAA